MNDTVENKGVVIGQRTMLGDLMGLIVNEFRSMSVLWHEMSEDEQDSLIGKIELRCEKAVNECGRIIASQGAPSMLATVESVTFRDGVKAVLKLPAGSGAHALADRAQQTVLVAIPQSEQNMEGEKPVADPMQKPLDLAAASDPFAGLYLDQTPGDGEPGTGEDPDGEQPAGEPGTGDDDA